MVVVVIVIVVVVDSKGGEKILLLPKALDLDRPKRTRTAFAKWQLDGLERAFELNPYLVGEQRSALAKRLALSETQVKRSITWPGSVSCCTKK